MKLLLDKKTLLVCLIGILIGALLILGIRVVAYAPLETAHYHANFAVYVNGEREEFEGVKYYEETAAVTCTLEPVASPKGRAHMHGNVSDAVHIEDDLVTWGNFVQNIGWGLGDNYLKTDDGIHTASDQGELTFILNGEAVSSVSNQVIGDEDKLLISYGVSDEVQLQKQYESIASTASKLNTEDDPAGCGGGYEAKFSDRFKNLF